MHEYGDDWFNKNGTNFYKEIERFRKFTTTFGLIKFMNKEKYGVHRTEFLTIWDGGLHYFTCKSYVRICQPFIYWKVDPIVKFITKWTGIHWLFNHYQFFIWNLGVQRMAKRHPEFVDEFVRDLGLVHRIKPGIFGKVDGMKIHNKYWKNYRID